MGLMLDFCIVGKVAALHYLCSFFSDMEDFLPSLSPLFLMPRRLLQEDKFRTEKS